MEVHCVYLWLPFYVNRFFLEKAWPKSEIFEGMDFHTGMKVVCAWEMHMLAHSYKMMSISIRRHAHSVLSHCTWLVCQNCSLEKSTVNLPTVLPTEVLCCCSSQTVPLSCKNYFHVHKKEQFAEIWSIYIHAVSLNTLNCSVCSAHAPLPSTSLRVSWMPEGGLCPQNRSSWPPCYVGMKVQAISVDTFIINQRGLSQKNLRVFTRVLFKPWWLKEVGGMWKGWHVDWLCWVFKTVTVRNISSWTDLSQVFNRLLSKRFSKNKTINLQSFAPSLLISPPRGSFPHSWGKAFSMHP